MIFTRFTILLLLFSGNLKASEFSSREVFNKLLKGFYKNEIQPKSILLSIVGDSAKIDLEELKKIGPLTQVQPKKLFNR